MQGARNFEERESEDSPGEADGGGGELLPDQGGDEECGGTGIDGGKAADAAARVIEESGGGVGAGLRFVGKCEATRKSIKEGGRSAYGDQAEADVVPGFDVLHVKADETNEREEGGNVATIKEDAIAEAASGLNEGDGDERPCERDP
ncbi:MAG: hypothetical protein ACRD5L_05490 [Bryobacteraceae bacterium]